jgi:hypothetical protein
MSSRSFQRLVEHEHQVLLKTVPQSTLQRSARSSTDPAVISPARSIFAAFDIGDRHLWLMPMAKIGLKSSSCLVLGQRIKSRYVRSHAHLAEFPGDLRTVQAWLMFRIPYPPPCRVGRRSQDRSSVVMYRIPPTLPSFSEVLGPFKCGLCTGPPPPPCQVRWQQDRLSRVLIIRQGMS